MPLTQGPPPVIVIEAADPGVDAPALDEVSVPAGWTRREGFALPDRPWNLAPRRWICVGRITDEDEARAALAALVRGVGLVVDICDGARFRLRVLDDLHRVGQVTVIGSVAGPVVLLPTDGEALLEALAAGATVEEAARAVNVSPRTAHRRLAAIRASYGAANTTEALACWLAERGER